MISEREAAKVYGRNTQVIRKGEPGWKSDNHQAGRIGESYGVNPWSKQAQALTRRAAAEVDPELLPDPADHLEGDVIEVAHVRDLVAFRLVDGKWKRAWTKRNGAL